MKRLQDSFAAGFRPPQRKMRWRGIATCHPRLPPIHKQRARAQPPALTGCGMKGMSGPSVRLLRGLFALTAVGNPACANQGNSKMTADLAATGVAAQELKQFVERVERLEEEKKGITGDIREVYAEMKGRGFDVKAVREIIKIRRQDHSERKEMEAILELYMSALNMR